jgi:hypothetical protein
MTNLVKPSTSSFLIAATFLAGLLAGFNLDRSLVHNPGWCQLGASAWAAYSQHADLSARGGFLYPFLGIGEAVLAMAAIVGLPHSSSGVRAVPLYAAALFAVVGLMTTVLAGPNMLMVPWLAGNPAGLQKALDGFVFWGDVRGALQILAFFALLWSLVVMTSRLENRA